jgi:hypothetical protein
MARKFGESIPRADDGSVTQMMTSMVSLVLKLLGWCRNFAVR